MCFALPLGVHVGVVSLCLYLFAFCSSYHLEYCDEVTLSLSLCSLSEESELELSECVDASGVPLILLSSLVVGFVSLSKARWIVGGGDGVVFLAS